MNWRVLGILALLILVSVSGAYAVGLIPYSPRPHCSIAPIGSISIPNAAGRFDHMAFDLLSGRLFIAALGNNSLDVVNINSGKLDRSLGGFQEPQGVLYVPTSGAIYVTNGGNGEVYVLSSDATHRLANISLGSDADNIRYDWKSNLIYVGYGQGAIASINASNNTVIGSVQLSGHPESFQLEANSSLMFVNVAARGYVAAVDRANDSVVARWPLANASGNYPMALDEKHGRLFVGTRFPSQIVVLDTGTERPITTVQLPQDPDDIYYDGANGCIYVSSGSGHVTIIEQTNPTHYSLVSEVSTYPGARTSLLVPERGLYFVVAPGTGITQAKVLLYKVG